MLSEHFPQINMYIYIYIDHENYMYKITCILFYEQNKKNKNKPPQGGEKITAKMERSSNSINF